MVISNLPGPGINFRATAGAGNFKVKLSGATRYGDLKNLRDNQRAIVDAVKSLQIQRAIKRGGLSRLQQLGAWYKIKASDKTITKEDKREIKQVLKHLGSSGTTKEKKPAATETSVKASDGKSYLTENQVKRNLIRSKFQSRPGSRDRQLYSTQYGGGKVEIASLRAVTDEPSLGGRRTKGIMEDLKIQRGTTGFAQGFIDEKLTDNPPPAAPTKGVKPIGM